MANYFAKKGKLQQEQEKYYREKANLRLKYAAVISITISVILMIATVIWLDSISTGMLLFMRGCAGLFAIIFVVLAAILVYRVNASYLKDKTRR